MRIDHYHNIGEKAGANRLATKQAGKNVSTGDNARPVAEKSTKLGAANTSAVPIVLATAGLATAAYIIYKGVVTYRFATSLNVGLHKVVVRKSDLLKEGLRIGVSLAISNPTQTTASFLHPMVDFGGISQTLVKDKKTGATKLVDSSFNRLVQSLPKTGTTATPYDIPPLGKIVTDYIEFVFPPMVMVQMLGNVDWLSLVAAILNKNMPLAQKANMMKRILLHSKYGIRPYLYVNGIHLPAIVIKF